MDKVRYIGASQAQVNWGRGDDPRGFLVIGDTYTVERREVHSWHTLLHLVECSGKAFNEVAFEAVSDGIEVAPIPGSRYEPDETHANPFRPDFAPGRDPEPEPFTGGGGTFGGAGASGSWSTPAESPSIGTCTADSDSSSSDSGSSSTGGE